jgi:hypothetical protein
MLEPGKTLIMRWFLTIIIAFVVQIPATTTPILSNVRELKEKRDIGNVNSVSSGRQISGETRNSFYKSEYLKSLPTWVDGDCGDCQNPLVQIMPLQIGGDIPDFKNYVGWESIRNGTRDFVDDYARGMEVVTHFMKANPCADISYEMENPNPYGNPIIHAGPKGQAKYEVRSWAVIEDESGGEKTLVKHVVYEITPLSEPRSTPGGSLQWNDVKEISNQLELVPVVGRVQISHDLIALKNGQIYDSGTEILDWIAEPTDQENCYFNASGESAEINGQTYHGSDGIMIGEFSSMSISGSAVYFDNGDIGKTIRKKETPVSLSIWIDYKSKSPLYVITISNIKNEMGEVLPDNVRIALKVRKGNMRGGEEISDWIAFNTTGGKVAEPILYRPPSCNLYKDDIIDYAGICEFNDSPPSIMEKRYQKNFPLECEDYEATLSIKGSYTKNENNSFERTSNGDVEKGNYSIQEIQEASFYVPLELENAGDMPILNQRWEYYRPLDINLTSFNASHRMRGYEYYNSSGGYGHEATTVRVKNPKNAQIPGKEYLLQSNIILIIDKKTDKVVKIATGGFPVEFCWDETEKTTGRSWNPDGSKPINESSHSTDDQLTNYSPGPVEDPVPDPTFTGISSSMRTYLKDLGTPLPENIEIPEDEEEIPETEPDLLVEFGDGKTFFGGDGKKIIDKSEGSTVHREEFNFAWQVTRKKKQ